MPHAPTAAPATSTDFLATVPASTDPVDAQTLLDRLSEGDESARSELYALLYEDLYGRAQELMRHQRNNHTLQATALVNEAYMRLDRRRNGAFEDEVHFLAVASTAMRHVLIDHARKKVRAKRLATGQAVPLDQVAVEIENRSVDIEALDRALEELRTFDEVMATAVDLRFFGGCSVARTAQLLGVPKRTFERNWKATRAWLHTKVG